MRQLSEIEFREHKQHSEEELDMSTLPSEAGPLNGLLLESLSNIHSSSLLMPEGGPAKLRKGQVLGAVSVFVAIALLILYLVAIPILHYYSWTGISPPVEFEGIIDFIDSYAGILMIPVVLGTIAACGVLCWIGWVLIRTPDGEPDWSGILESDEEL